MIGLTPFPIVVIYAGSACRHSSIVVGKLSKAAGQTNHMLRNSAPVHLANALPFLLDLSGLRFPLPTLTLLLCSLDLQGGMDHRLEVCRGIEREGGGQGCARSGALRGR